MADGLLKRLVQVLLGVGFVGSLAVVFVLSHRSNQPIRAEEAAHLRARGSTPLWSAPVFSLRSSRGEWVSSKSLAGTPYIANFIFTTCRTICPLLTAKMVRLQRELPGVRVHFVSFSVDPTLDTVEALESYRQQWNPQDARWSLLANTDASLKSLALGFRVAAQRSDSGIDAVIHTSVFLLVDSEGNVRGVFDSEDPRDFQQLRESALRLAQGAPSSAPRTQRTGEELYHELSCANCHERSELAPPLGGLLGKQRELENGLLVKADDAYFKESVHSPDLKRVKGYPLRMPTYVGLLNEEELNSLQTYVAQLAQHEAGSLVETVVDPVCQMKIRPTGSTIHLKVSDGGVAYFCSSWCLKRFKEDPESYPYIAQ